MKYSTFAEEKKLWKQGYKVVACLDEVGRGPLAGPVMACAVAIRRPGKFPKLRDSKQLSTKQREYFYDILTTHPNIEWGIGKVYQKVIDRINIYNATKLAMKRALEKLDTAPDFLIVDGNMRLDVSIAQRAIVKADEQVFSCAAASVIAKVKRDHAMARYHKRFPQYGFHAHKGYGTREHFKALKKHGPCPIHRKSFLDLT